MVATNLSPAEEQAAERFFDDGPGWPNVSEVKERAYRLGFLTQSQRVLNEWVNPNEDFDLQGELESALKDRRGVRELCRLPVQNGQVKWRSGHAIAAADARGRHQALECVVQAWDEVADLDVLREQILPIWLCDVEKWAAEPIDTGKIMPPPFPLEAEGAAEIRDNLSRVFPPALVANRNPLGTTSQNGGLRLVRADRIEIKPPDWLIRGIVERDTLGLVFGDPGSGKSFLTIDWACRIATGTPWRGQPVKAGPVIYIAGEGHNGLGRRLYAWQEYHGISLEKAPLYVAPAVAITDPTQFMDLAVAIKQCDQPAMIVLDTLARCFGAGDENSTQDMSQFVSVCDALRRRFGCTVLIVHHSGHADKNRARGAMALKAALDAEYRLSSYDNLTLTATKMKDAETPAPLGLELVTVPLPDIEDEYGNQVTSAVIKLNDPDLSEFMSNTTTSKPRGKWQDVGIAVARRLLLANGAEQISIDIWRDECKAAGMVRQNQHRVLEALSNRGDFIINGEFLSIPHP